MARRLFSPFHRKTMMLSLTNPLFWDKKIKIAILALATFIAMC
ncbi:MAG: hypothetical protein ABSG31_16630 [Tepidisphaeraceae bacterium]|jgi:hypothetical protein